MSTVLSMDRGLLAKVGSFWTSTLRSDERPKARMLVNRGSLGRYYEPLGQAVEALTGGEWMDDFNVDITFQEKDIVELGAPPTFAREESGIVPIVGKNTPSIPATDSSVSAHGETDGKGRPVWAPPAGREGVSELPVGTTAYALRLPPEIAPIRIVAETGDLFVNEDFFIRNNYLVLFTHPAVLFPGFRITVASARRAIASLFCGVLRLDQVYGSTQPVADFYRNNFSPANWLAAAACAGGLGLFTTNGVIRSVVPLENGGSLYVTDDEIVTVDYPHPGLSVNDQVMAGQIVGDVLRMYQAKDRDASWWWSLFPDGLPLDGLVNYEGLKIPAGACAVTFAGWSPTGRPHVTIKLDGPSSRLDALWENIRLQEVATGRWVFDAVGLPTPDPDTPVGTTLGSVDGIAWYMRNILGSRCVVIALRTSVLGQYRTERVRRFLYEQRPLGMIPLFVEAP